MGARYPPFDFRVTPGAEGREGPQGPKGATGATGAEGASNTTVVVAEGIEKATAQCASGEVAVGGGGGKNPVLSSGNHFTASVPVGPKGETLTTGGKPTGWSFEDTADKGDKVMAYVVCSK